MYLIYYTAICILIFQYTVSGSMFDVDPMSSYSEEDAADIDDDITAHWIQQDVDHFNTSDTRKWNMKYLENIKYWKENGPIYLLLQVPSVQIIQPETPTDYGYENFLSNGLMYQLANETNGAMYALIKRYYAHFQNPVNGSDPNYLKYISSEQSLADVATLIKSLKALPKYEKSKVVLVGGGYGGNLAVWMRMHYPDLVDAALASSARVLAKTDFSEALEIVTDDYRKYGSKGCLSKISGHFDYLHNLTKTPEGRERIKKEQNICQSSDLSILDNQGILFQSMIGTYIFMCRFTNPDFIKKHCNRDVVRFPESLMYPFTDMYSESRHCFNIDFKTIMLSWRKYIGYEYFLIPTFYQQCDEFGHLMTTTSKKQVFYGVSLEYLIHWCSGLFGDDFDKNRVDKGVKHTNQLFGGLNPNVSKVIFTNGEIDPFTELGITKDLSEDAPAIVIKDASESFDLHKDRPSDTPALRAARKHIKNNIKKWIGAIDDNVS